MSKVPYASAVGCLMYAMVCTRPDLAQGVSVVSKFLANLGKQHWDVVKWIFRYLRGMASCLKDNRMSYQLENIWMQTMQET